jgi:hypothetical protein
VRIARSLAAALVLLLPAQARGAEGAAELLRRLDTATPEGIEQAARALAALGPGAMAELFALVGPQAKGAQDEALARSFALQPRSELQSFFAGFTRAALEPQRIGPALLVLREAGSAREFARCLELAGPGEGEGTPELVAALAGICTREPAACELALSQACSAPPGEVEAIVRGLSEAHNGPSALALARLAQRRPEFACVALSALLSVAEQLPRPADADLLALLRGELAREDHPAAQELLLLAGRLGDDESVPLLLKRLAGARADQRANAHWSLRRITGLGLGPDAAAWSQWFKEEQQWWKDRAPAVLELLHGDDLAAQARALEELGQRFWHRQQVADELVEYLARAHSAGARMACGLLGNLGCPSALPALQARLEDEDMGVQQSARAAVAGLTGKKIPSRAVGLAR